MKKYFPSFLLFLVCFYGQSQDRLALPPRQIQIELNSLKSTLANTIAYFSNEPRPNITSAGRLISFFGINGEEKSYQLIETPVLSKEYSKDHPEFKSYTGVSVDGKTQVKLSITPAGLTGVLIEAGEFYYIEKSKSGVLNEYDLFDQSQIKGNGSCGFNEVPTKIDEKNLRSAKGVSNTHGSQLRNFRMAVACTGEFTTQNGGNIAGANARINSLLTLINARYETELSTTFTLVATNDNIVYTDPNTDPFTPPGGASAGHSQSVFTNSLNTAALMPYANYDIGQTLHFQPGGGGFASAAGQAGSSPCNDNTKARSWTQYSESSPGNANDAFLTGIIIHEMGHQFGTGHTFTGSGSNCNPGTGQFTIGSAYEPGSGNTIMSYNGICGAAYNLAGGKVSYFHARSLFQISESLNGSGGSCVTPTVNANNVPAADAGADFTIPKSTPFILNGSGSDADTGDVLSYTWDQYNQPVANDQGALGTLVGIGGYDGFNSTTAPIFRTRQSSTGERTFPALSFILDNSNVPANNVGEALPAVARDIDMRLVVRDNKALGGAYDTDDVKITIDNSGPFLITSQNSNTLWFQGTTQSITWDVNGTDQAPVSCANVKISLSDDGGTTFNTVVVASTPNNGSYNYLVPNVSSTQVRIKVEAIGNIFFDINNVDITITNQTCTPFTSSISDVSSISATEGSSNLSLNLTPLAPTASYDYTFLVVNTVNDQISLFNSTADLRSLPPGSFQVYGFSYGIGTNLGPYITTTLSSFQTGITNGSICGILSSNFKPVTITACPSIPNAPSASPVSIFNNESATLIASGCSATYNWYESVNSSTVISTGASFTSPSLSQSRSYFVSCLEICESQRTEVVVTVIDFCAITANCTFGDLISKVVFRRDMVDFFTQSSTCGSGGYTFYNSAGVDITQGELIGIEVTKNITFPAGLAVWIDYNSNRIFELSERVLSFSNNQTDVQFNSFTVPANAAVGNTRMRVKIDYNGSTSDPCLNQGASDGPTDGEVEDYLINILSASTCADQLTLTSPTDDITTGTSTFESNNNAAGSNEGLISATNKITGGNTTFSAGKKVELNQGFEASGGAVFSAQIGGCSN